MPRTSEPIKAYFVTVDGRQVKRYLAVTDAPKGQDGKRKQVKRRFGKRKDAVDWLASMRTGSAPELQPGAVAVPTFDSVAEPWLEVKRRTVRPVTAYAYAGAVKVWKEHLGDAALDQIGKAEIEALVNAYQDAGKSVARVSYLLMVVRSILDEAVEEGLIGRNVAARVKARGAAPKERRAMTAEQVKAVRAKIAEHRLESLWLLSLAGMRRSEVVGLRWSDVDLDARQLRIVRARVQIGGSKRIDETATKTRNGTRTLVLPAPIIDALKRFRAVQAEELGLVQVRDGYIGVDEIGEPIRPEWYSDEWGRLLASARVEHFTLHEARHTSVTLMRDLGIDDHLVAEWHGHDEVVMRRTYSHASESGLDNAGTRLFEATS